MLMSFLMVRDSDQSGVSGVGRVGWAVEYPHGAVSVSFRDDSGPGVKSYYWYDSLDDAERIHGHGGATKFIPVDQVEYELGVSMANAEDDTLYTLEGDETVSMVAGYEDSKRRNWGEHWSARCGKTLG